MQPKLIFGWVFFPKNLSFKMSWLAGTGSPEVYLFVDLLKNLSIMPLGIFLVWWKNEKKKKKKRKKTIQKKTKKKKEKKQYYLDQSNLIDSLQL